MPTLTFVIPDDISKDSTAYLVCSRNSTKELWYCEQRASHLGGKKAGAFAWKYASSDDCAAKAVDMGFGKTIAQWVASRRPFVASVYRGPGST